MRFNRLVDDATFKELDRKLGEGIISLDEFGKACVSEEDIEKIKMKNINYNNMWEYLKHCRDAPECISFIDSSRLGKHYFMEIIFHGGTEGNINNYINNHPDLHHVILFFSSSRTNI